MCTYLFFWQSDGFDQVRQVLILQGCHTQTLPDLINHGIIPAGAGCRILSRYSSLLQLVNCQTSGEVQCGPGGGEVQKFTGKDKSRTGRPDMDLFGATLEKVLHIIFQLGSSHDRVVANTILLPAMSSFTGISFILATRSRISWFWGMKLRGQVGVYFT